MSVKRPCRLSTRDRRAVACLAFPRDGSGDGQVMEEGEGLKVRQMPLTSPRHAQEREDRKKGF